MVLMYPSGTPRTPLLQNSPLISPKPMRLKTTPTLTGLKRRKNSKLPRVLRALRSVVKWTSRWVEPKILPVPL